MSLVHLFGELDLDLSKDIDKIAKRAFNIAEQCGYMPAWKGHNDKTNSGVYLVSSGNCEVAKLEYANGKVIKADVSEDDGATWQNVHTKSGKRRVTPATLKKYKNQIKFGQEKSLPMSQGLLIQEIIKQIGIRPIGWGYHFNLVGLETKKQFLIWRDTGVSAEFLGGINKDGSDFKW
jgi:hypothetical protein